MTWEHSILDRSVTKRMKKLGDLGEALAEKLLRKAGFTNVRNLNIENNNNKYADIYAEKGAEKYVISVRTRNKYENNGSLNGRYKLKADCHEQAAKMEKKFDASAAWVTIAIETDKGTFDAYFGTLESLQGNTGVPMSEKATCNYEKLARHESLADYGIEKGLYKELKNIYKTRI